MGLYLLSFSLSLTLLPQMFFSRLAFHLNFLYLHVYSSYFTVLLKQYCISGCLVWAVFYVEELGFSKEPKKTSQLSLHFNRI